MQYIDSEFYHEFTQVLRKEEKEVIKQGISSSFFLSGVIADPKHMQVILTGTLNRWVDDLPLTPAKKKYLLKFTYKRGVLKVKSFADVSAVSDASTTGED